MDRPFKDGLINIEKPLQCQKVYRQLKQAIHDGDIKRGTWIQEDQICKVLGASRTPVREAFNRLKGEGILEIVHRKGARVVDMSAAQIGALYEARMHIELIYFLKSAKSLTREKYRQLKNELSEIERKVLNSEAYSEEWEKYRKKYVRVDRNFHDQLILECGNEFWVKVYLQIRDLITISGAKRSFTSEGIKSAIREHHEILDALIEGRFQDARDLMANHIMNTLRYEENDMRQQEMADMVNNIVG
jgi:DNA-binding GntR family transcriptional regulator